MNDNRVPDELADKYTQEQWDNLCCCACYGCEEHPHECHLTDEQRVKAVAAHDAALMKAIADIPDAYFQDDEIGGERDDD